jgi:hypothetical protein
MERWTSSGLELIEWIPFLLSILVFKQKLTFIKAIHLSNQMNSKKRDSSEKINLLESIPIELGYILVSYVLGNEYYDKFIERMNVSSILSKVINDEYYAQLLFYEMVPYYFHIKKYSIFDGIDNWRHAFEVAYRNTYPPRGKDCDIRINGTMVRSPVHNAFTEYGQFRLKEMDKKGIPIKFILEKYNTHNRLKGCGGIKFSDAHLIKEVERKGSKWYYKSKYSGQLMSNENSMFGMLEVPSRLSMYYSFSPNLAIPAVRRIISVELCNSREYIPYEIYKLTVVDSIVTEFYAIITYEDYPPNTSSHINAKLNSEKDCYISCDKIFYDGVECKDTLSYRDPWIIS